MNGQTLNPSGNGWDIADSSGRYSAAGGWTAAPGTDSGRFSVIASVNPTLAASNVTATSATLTLSHPNGKWHYKRTAPSAGTCSGAHNRTTTDAITNLAPGVEYTYKAYSDAACSTEIAATKLTMPTLAASNITDDGATLALGGSYTGDWYYKRTAPASGTCTLVSSAQSVDVTGLDAGASYVFEAYSDSGCAPANRLAIADIFTTYISVSNTSAAFASNSFNVGREDNSSETHYYATPFRTGGASAGYTLKRVNASFSDGVGSPPDIRVRIYPNAETNLPGSPSRVTLNGSNPTSEADYAYTCPIGNSGCALNAATQYHLAFELASVPAAANNYYQWKRTTSTNETTDPTGNGWTIGNNGSEYDVSTGSWTSASPQFVGPVRGYGEREPIPRRVQRDGDLRHADDEQSPRQVALQADRAQSGYLLRRAERNFRQPCGAYPRSGIHLQGLQRGRLLDRRPDWRRHLHHAHANRVRRHRLRRDVDAERQPPQQAGTTSTSRLGAEPAHGGVPERTFYRRWELDSTPDIHLQGVQRQRLLDRDNRQRIPRRIHHAHA